MAPSYEKNPSCDTLTDDVRLNKEESGTLAEVASDIVELGPAERARLLRKLDLHVLPIVSLLYLLCFL